MQFKSEFGSITSLEIFIQIASHLQPLYYSYDVAPLYIYVFDNSSTQLIITFNKIYCRVLTCSNVFTFLIIYNINESQKILFWKLITVCLNGLIFLDYYFCNLISVLVVSTWVCITSCQQLSVLSRFFFLCRLSRTERGRGEITCTTTYRPTP